MIRILLTYVLPLVLPALLYIFWVKISRVFGSNPDRQLRDGPWFWLAVAGFALMTAGMVALALIGTNPTEGTYQPPRVEDGKIIPGHIVPDGTQQTQ